jgi:hypothetical protein
MHVEDNNFMHRGKIRNRMGRMIVQFYKLEFVST